MNSDIQCFIDILNKKNKRKKSKFSLNTSLNKVPFLMSSYFNTLKSKAKTLGWNVNMKEDNYNTTTYCFVPIEKNNENNKLDNIMKKSELKQIIKEEIKNTIKEKYVLYHLSSKDIKKYLTNVLDGWESETWLAFKDLQGQWRTVTASFAA